MVLLLFTRVRQIGLYSILNSLHPSFKIPVGTLFNFHFSASFVLYLDQMFGIEDMHYKLPILYIPLVFPFTVVSLLTIWIYHKNMDEGSKWYDPFTIALDRLRPTILPLMAALVLVQLIVGGAAESPAYIAGK